VLCSTDCITQSIGFGYATTCTIEFIEKDAGDAAELLLETAQDWITTQGTTVTFLPMDLGLMGANAVEVRISDGQSFVPVTFTVTISDFNYPPTIDSTSCKTISMQFDTTKTCTLTYSDVDAGEAFSVSLPDGITWVSEASDVITLSPALADIGAYEVTVRVTDSNVLSKANGVQYVDHSFIVTVAEFNSPPVILEADCWSA